MLSILSIDTEEISPGLYRSHWHSSSRQFGVIETSINQHYKKPLAAAELAAIHHVVVERAVFGADRYGDNVAIQLSSGAARKALKQSGDADLQQFAYLLSVRLQSATVSVSNNLSWRDGLSFRVNEQITPPALLDDYVTSPLLGRLVITRHALDDVMGRDSPDTEVDALKTLKRRVARSTKKLAYPERIMTIQLQRHGVRSIPLYDEIDKVAFIIAPPRVQAQPVVAAMITPGGDIRQSSLTAVSESDLQAVMES